MPFDKFRVSISISWYDTVLGKMKQTLQNWQ